MKTALLSVFKNEGIDFAQQPNDTIIFEGESIGTYIPDLVAFNKVIIDTKTIDKITDREMGQMINYLRVTGLRVGLIINFKHPKLEWERVVV